MPLVTNYAPCERSCEDCAGTDHHWVPGFDEDSGIPIMLCKHCPTRRVLGDDEDPDEPDFRAAEPTHLDRLHEVLREIVGFYPQRMMMLPAIKRAKALLSREDSPGSTGS